MAIIAYCDKHGQSAHTTSGQCIACSNQKEAEELKEWEEMPVDKKLRDLHRRIKRLEKGPTKS